ncbi:Starch-binding associating with outer membrane [Chitinophaga jiangningensis]|uniref:Starch-binding associating with outer membrane n=1 Tax=Chitinophaga jiangningensis TaxID=1419482 RepID=A0A1M7F8W2_9BACT|nr:RagB/SusD family nutrient uptake outer membrane protein [Chitinophaga jiangningensis]SHM00405.1 Starch-binding associating with outer membrane [Chitinophaga jiangningensis]
MKKFKVLLYTAGLLSLASCKQDLLDTLSYTQQSDETMWTTDNLTDQGMAGVYAALRLGIDQSSASGNELYQFDRYGVGGMVRDADGLQVGTITPSSSMFSNNWKYFYDGIQRANGAIVNIPLKSPSADDKKARYVAEAKFLRAYFYLRLNQLWHGVPVYLKPFTADEATKGRETEDSVWRVVINDLSDCINEPNLPAKYGKGNANYGHITKGAAYALRGKAYLYTKNYPAAAADFAKVEAAGYTLFNGDYKALFKEANEQSDEMIFSLQNIAVSNFGSTTQFFCGNRSSFGSCWNTYLVSPVVVDLYENADGSRFDWNKIIPGYSSKAVKQREVYFFRDGLTTAEINAATARGLDMSVYLPVGNEARIKAAYANRDPRLAANVITPYADYLGVNGSANQSYVSRWPFRSNTTPVWDVATDTKAYFYYLHRKFVYEGATETINRAYGPTDFPVIRYADVLLMWAEAINEQGFNQQALDLVNKVRARVNMPALQNTDAGKPTYVADQASMRERIRNERRVEFVNEGINYFDELRWKTWKEKTFGAGAGIQQVWGANVVNYSWKGDYIYAWPIPQAEIERNQNLKQNDGWIN